jgi:hypothetical protein
MVTIKDQVACYQVYRRALALGIIRRPGQCSECANTRGIQGHHKRYSQPLIVTWLCRSCHAKRHPFKKHRRALVW